MAETSSQSVPSFFHFVKIVLHINSRGLLPRTVRVGLWRRVSSLVLHLGSADGYIILSILSHWFDGDAAIMSFVLIQYDL